MSTEAEVWERVRKGTPTECWPWKGSTGKKNQYGRIKYNGVHWKTHRLIYTLTRGKIAPGMFICHTCDNPPCCNPDHLFEGTSSENIHDAMRKGRLRGVKSDEVSGTTYVGVRLPNELVAAINAEAAEWRASRSWVIRRILTKGLQKRLVGETPKEESA